MATNDFLPFANANGANVGTLSDYVASSGYSSGYMAGVAQSKYLNRTWRQSAAFAAMLGQLIVDKAGVNAADDGVNANLTAAFLAMLSSPSVFTTPAQGANDTKSATTEFVQRALGNFSNFVAYPASQTITAAQSGNLIGYSSTSAAGTFTLPSPVGMSGKLAYTITNYSSFNLTVTTPVGVFTRGGGGSSIVLQPGTGVLLASDNVNWQLVGTDASLLYSPLFATLKSANGYQKLPGGTIIQWGGLQNLGGGTNTVTFPIPFPNAITAFIPQKADASYGSAVSAGPPTLTSSVVYFVLFANGALETTTARAATWIAIGY